MTSTHDDLRDHLRQKISLPSHGEESLYGRSAEESILINSYYASLTLTQNSPSNLILICGESGLGKTKLAETLRSYAMKDEGFFIRGKFDQSSYGEANLPYSGIANAFREYCSLLLERPGDRDQVINGLRKAIDENEGSFLCEAIPSLRSIINHVPSHHLEVDSTSTKSRFHILNYLMQKFIRVVSSFGDPIILLLDDMQWSDASSMELLKTLAASAKNPFLFVLTFRPVPKDHPFHQFIDGLEERKNVTEVRLHGLNNQHVYDMVSGILGETERGICRSLSDFLCRVTNGNPLMVRQQIISLLDNGLIYFDNGCLTWDMQKIEESSTIFRSLSIMTLHKIKRLSELTQRALLICACIGSRIDYEVLGFLVGEVCPNNELLDFAETDIVLGRKAILPAISDGLLTESWDGASASFIHDSVQSAAYSLLPTEEQAPFHLKLGQALNSKLNLSTSPSHIMFTVANQLARAYELVQEDERIQVARIFVRAGDESKSAGAFRGAHYFYAKAIGVLRSSDWLTEYDLSLNAHLNGAEVAVWSGATQNADEWLDIVSVRTRGSVMNQLRTTWMKVNLLATKGQLEAAIELGLKDLASLTGVQVKSKNLKTRTLVAMWRTRRLMRGHTETTLLACSRMKNERMNAALRLLHFIALLCAAGKPKMTPLVCFKLLELNIKFGISSTMPTAMTWYGVILIHFGYAASEAAKYGQIALRLQDVLECTDTRAQRAQVAALFYGMINTYSSNLSDCIKPLFDGHICGLQSGDVRHAMVCAQAIGTLSFHSGQELTLVAATLEKFGLLMKDYNTTTLFGVNQIYEQAVANLTGRLTSPRERGTPKGSAFNKHDTCSKTPLENEHALTMQVMIAYLLDDYDLAWRTSENLHKSQRPASLMFYVAAFFEGMTALAFAPIKGSRKTNVMKAIKSSRKSVEKISKKSPINFDHFRHLIEAEYATFLKQFASAERSFLLSVEHASESGATHLEALAWERWAHCHLTLGDLDVAYEKLRIAHNLYAKWGEISSLDALI
ncbi:hypothetical protein ACHAWX_005068 [Stephanocyclus meneghinianus]